MVYDRAFPDARAEAAGKETWEGRARAKRAR
jgi:hypothetical protein